MIHLFKHSTGKLKGKYDIALVVKGRYILGSNQGYNRKSGCYAAMRNLLKQVNIGLHDCIYFQDDTDINSFWAYYVSLSNTKIWLSSKKKTSKPYVPNKK